MTHQPARTHLPPDLAQYHADLARRTRQLEQRPQGPDHGPFCTIVANAAGNATQGDRTDRWFPWRSAIDVQYVIADAGNTSDTGATLSIYRGLTPVITLVFPPGGGVIREGHDLRWSPGEALWMQIEDGSVGLLNVSLRCRGLEDGRVLFPTDDGGPEG